MMDYIMDSCEVIHNLDKSAKVTLVNVRETAATVEHLNQKEVLEIKIK